MTDNRRLLELALKGLTAERESIDREIAEITAQMNGGSEPVKTAAPSPTSKRKPRKLSAAGRKAIIEATKRRWADYRKAQAKAAK